MVNVNLRRAGLSLGQSGAQSPAVPSGGVALRLNFIGGYFISQMGKERGQIFMRIALLTSYFYHKTAEYDGEDRIIFGGAERALFELCRFLQEEGHEVTVFQPLPMTDRNKQYGAVETGGNILLPQD
jgi:hypothetical protein